MYDLKCAALCSSKLSKAKSFAVTLKLAQSLPNDDLDGVLSLELAESWFQKIRSESVLGLIQTLN